ncbi:MAG: TonB-dependent receptor [Muribaculaceae bacterium]|nr:TonB-dependent receptor [Muribaculaceae bacterium]
MTKRIHTFLLSVLAVMACALYPAAAFAQNNLTLTGKVTDADNGEPLEFVIVQLPERNLWAETDEKGIFSIKNLRPGTYTVFIQSTGYQDYTHTIDLSAKAEPLLISLHPSSLALKEVTVTASTKRMGSTSQIGREAVQHIQPKSLEDMMQLVPGNVTKNPDLNSIGQAQIREIDNNSNNAMGTLVMVDGAPMSNDANMQTFTTSKGGSTPSQSTAGKGVDLRLISPDNIESIEVVRGIPSVEYGNLTSGAVIVKSRTGATPWEIKLKADPYSKMAYAGKGFGLAKGGAINVTADYSQSYSDIRKKYIGYDRVTFGLGYGNVFMKDTRPLSFNARFSFFSSLNNEKSDPELMYQERINNKTIGGRFSLDGNWSLQMPFISTLSFAASANYIYESDYANRQVILQSGITPVGNATSDKEYQTFYLSSTYYAWSKITGRPLDLYAQLKGDRLFNFQNGAFMTIKLGAEWRFNKNYGVGMRFDEKNPPQVTNNQSLRPRPFKSIPAMNVLSFFLEDKFTTPIGTTSLTAQAGARLSNIFLDEKKAHRGNMTTVEPRANIDYNILNSDNNSFLQDFSIAGGYGVGMKTPTLLQFYPDMAYFDVTSFAMLFPDDVSGDKGKSLAVMTTKVIDNTANPNLKPAFSYKTEAGFTFRKDKVSGMINYFNERHKNEFGYVAQPVIMEANRYSTPSGIDAVRYEDGKVQYQSGGVWHDATATPHTYYFSYLMPSNSVKTKKWGIEYQINLAAIPAIKTSISVDGAYLWIKRRSTADYYTPVSATVNGDTYPYIALMPGGSGTVSTRFNTNFRFITHIPKLQLIFTTTLQMIWRESYQAIYENNDGKSLVYRTQDPFSPNREVYAVNPVGFLNSDNKFTEWEPGFAQDPVYRYMVATYVHPRAFDTEVLPTSAILNFRLTKEFGKIVEISFMANNFLKLMKTHKLETAVGWKDVTIPMYFGAEVKLKF